MKLLNKKGNVSTLRKVVDDDKTKVLAVVGTVRDLVHEHVFDYCTDKPDRWACVRTDYEAFFGDSREEAIAAAGIC